MVAQKTKEIKAIVHKKWTIMKMKIHFWKINLLTLMSLQNAQN